MIIGRYRLIVRVADPTGTTTFTLFNKDVERLIHVPIETVVQQNQEVFPFFPKMRNKLIAPFVKCPIQTFLQANPPADIPEVLNNVIGKTCAFDIKITGYNTNLGYEDYTVVKLSEHNPGGNQAIAERNGVVQEEAAELEANIA